MTTTEILIGIKNWVLSFIPPQASAENQLADKAFVNSSIATATATFRGTYNAVNHLGLQTLPSDPDQLHAAIVTALTDYLPSLQPPVVADNNDYVFVQVPTAVATPTQIASVEKYKYNGTAWGFEYALNNSGFTAAQWAAINSGATLELIGKLSDLPTNSELTTLLNGKVDKVSGKGLSTNDYTTEEKNKLGALPTNTDLNAALGAKAAKTDLENGTIVPKLATNLESWEGREDLTVNSTFSEPVRTTAGDASIVSSKGGKIVSIVPRSDFYASALKATGFNLLRNAVQIGTTTKYYFLVPKLIFGTFGTADEPNGVLFTNAQGGKMTPAVYFKKLSDGVPTSSSYGSACTYTDNNGYRFYTCSEIGYMVVDDVTLASTCAHIAWSRRYDEYKAIDAAGDAGSSISLAAIFTALHAANQPALFITNEVRDFIEFTNTTAVWHRVCNKTTVSSWTNTEIPSEGGGASTYIHSAAISGMKSGGVARIGSTMLTVEGTTVSFTDSNATAAAADVVYELATQASGTVSITPTFSLEDWGLEYLEGATGTAEVTTQYCRNYPDSLAALAQFDFRDLSLVVGEALAELFYDIQGIKSNMKRYTELIDEYGYPMRMGQRVFALTDGAPTEIPMSLGLVRLDASTGHMWVSKSLTISTSDWKQVQ